MADRRQARRWLETAAPGFELRLLSPLVLALAVIVAGWIAFFQWHRPSLLDASVRTAAIVTRTATATLGSDLEAAVRLVSYPEKIRGFGHVKQRQARTALQERDTLLAAFRAGEGVQLAEAAE